jgi:hypothetical protein
MASQDSSFLECDQLLFNCASQLHVASLGSTIVEGRIGWVNRSIYRLSR